MSNTLKTLWEGYVSPMLRRPRRLQVAALCHRDRDGRTEVLLITSRGTGRWIIPKGWMMRGHDAAQAAMREAWEEAGVRHGTVQTTPCGSYSYDKRLSSGLPVPVETLVFPVAVEALEDEFPEAAERKRQWVSAPEAANLVAEPELRSILSDLQGRAHALSGTPR